MVSKGRWVVRNRRLQFAGVAMLLVAAGLGVLAYVAIVSPGRDFDHPGGLTPGLRVFVVAVCVVAAVPVAVIGIGALRVVLIVDATGLTIRNSWRTTTVRWESRPRFATRDRRQSFSIVSPATMRSTRSTYRYRAIVCTAGRQEITIAATSRMSRRDRVDELLTDLREAGGRSRAGAR